MVDPDPEVLLANLGDSAALAERLVDAFVSRGLSPDGSVSLDDLKTLPATKVLLEALDARAKGTEASVEQVRLARLYALAGKTKRASKAFRLALAGKPLSLSLAVAMAEGAVAGGDRTLALGLLDWLACALMARDDRAEDRSKVDPIRADPPAMCALLRRAGDVAISIERPVRAVALLRTAANRYERMGSMRASNACLERAVDALRDTSKSDLALNYAMRLRVRAKERESGVDEAHAFGIVAGLLAGSDDATDFERAKTCRREAAKLLAREGDTRGALEHVRELALLEAGGSLTKAVRTLDGGVTEALGAGLESLACDLALEAARLELRLGLPGRALARVEMIRKAKPKGSVVALSTLIAVDALVLAGDERRASKALARWDSPSSDPLAAAWGLRVRGGLAALAGRTSDARAFLHVAARLLTAQPQRRGACLLHSAFLALESGDADAAADDLALAQKLELATPLDLRADIFNAVLCDDPDEQEILLDEVHERAAEEGDLQDQVFATVSLAKVLAVQESPESAVDLLEGAVTRLVSARDDLPESLRDRFARSPLCKAALELKKHAPLAAVLKRLR